MKRLLAIVIGMTLMSLLLSGSVEAAASPNAGKLLITEVAFKASTEWVELYVVDGSVDWSNYRVYKGGTLRFTIPSQWETNGLTTGDYIVLFNSTGTNDSPKGDNNHGFWDGFLNGGFYTTDDIIRIVEPSGSTKVVDVVIWSNNNSNFTGSQAEANNAVTDGMWDAGAIFSDTRDSDAWTGSDDISPSESLARWMTSSGSSYKDANSKNDWYEETSPTQGAHNDAEQATAVTLGTLVGQPTGSSGWLTLAVAVLTGLVAGAVGWAWRLRSV